MNEDLEVVTTREFDLHVTGSREEKTLMGSVGLPYGRLCFCHTDDEVANDFGLIFSARVVLIRLLLVHKEHRNQGHGKALIQEFLRHAQRWGYRYVIVGASPLQDDGLAFVHQTTPEFKERVKRLIAYYRSQGFNSSPKAINEWRLRMRLERGD